jgi:hypothetical protein
MTRLILVLALLSLNGCAVGILANAVGAQPGNVSSMHPEQSYSSAAR